MWVVGPEQYQWLLGLMPAKERRRFLQAQLDFRQERAQKFFAALGPAPSPMDSAGSWANAPEPGTEPCAYCDDPYPVGTLPHTAGGPICPRCQEGDD